MPQAIYLDSQSFAYLFSQPVFAGSGWTAAGTRELVRAVTEAVNADEISFVGSHFHLEEASRIPDDLGKRAHFVENFWSLVKWNMLSATFDLAISEAEHRRPLEAQEPFEDFWTRQALRKASRTDAEFDLIAKKVVTYVNDNVASSQDRRNLVKARLAKEFANLSVAEVTERWWQDASNKIGDWVADYIEKSQAHLKLPEDRTTWPAPGDLQTAWAIHAYQMARAVLNIGLNRKIGDGDAHDTHHYASACYADVFVTEDKAFRETLELIPNSPVTVLTFEQFAAQFGIAPH